MEESIKDLANKELDAAFIDFPDFNVFQAVPVARLHPCLVMDKRHPLSRFHAIDSSMLKGEKIICGRVAERYVAKTKCI